LHYLIFENRSSDFSVGKPLSKRNHKIQCKWNNNKQKSICQQ